jgi:hypothetical protein
MSMDFIGENAEERRKREIEAAIKIMDDISSRLMTEEVFGQHEILTELIPAIILHHVCNYGGCWGDEFYEPLNGVVFATQKLAQEGEKPEGLGCRWSDPSYEKLTKPGIFESGKPHMPPPTFPDR